MTRFLRPLAALLLAAAVGLPAGWYALSPWWTVNAMRDAAFSADPQALARHVDFPALRQSLKTELKARLQAEARAPETPLAAFGASLAIAFVDPFVDSAVSPAMLQLVVAGAGGLSELQPLALLAAPAVHIERDGFDHFTARIDGAGAEAPAAVFTRHGLGWKLSGIAVAAPDVRKPAS